MAENLQTTRPADEGWTTVIRPKTGWFDIDLQELWRYRDLIMMFVKRNFTVLYKQTILGPAWIILNPLITTVIFNVVFGGMANMPTDGVPGFLFYMAGNTVWTFFANCVNNTANTFVTNSQIFGKVYFPRLTMPVSQVLTSLINFGIQAVMYLIFWVYFFATGSGVTFTLWVLAVPFVVLEVMLLGLGVGSFKAKVRIGLDIFQFFSVMLDIFLNLCLLSLFCFNELHGEYFRRDAGIGFGFSQKVGMTGQGEFF